MASVAVLGLLGDVLWSGEIDAPQSAGAACMKLLDSALDENGLEVGKGTLFVADLGPGSFTGVRVGIMLAKTFGYVYGRPCAGVDAFDLISISRTVFVPLKKGECFVRPFGLAPYSSKEVPEDAIGYGVVDREAIYPRASGCATLLGSLRPVAAELLTPKYLLEPSISIPKTPFGAPA